MQQDVEMIACASIKHPAGANSSPQQSMAASVGPFEMLASWLQTVLWKVQASAASTAPHVVSRRKPDHFLQAVGPPYTGKHTLLLTAILNGSIAHLHGMQELHGCSSCAFL